MIFWIRLISIFLTSFAMMLLIFSLYKTNSKLSFSIIVSALIFALPGVGLVFTYILGFTTAISWSLSIFAFLLFYKLFDNKKEFNYKNYFRAKEIKTLLLAFILLIASISIYQPSVFFYF